MFNIQGPRGLDGPSGEPGTQGIKVSAYIAQYCTKRLNRSWLAIPPQTNQDKQTTTKTLNTTVLEAITNFHLV